MAATAHPRTCPQHQHSLPRTNAGSSHEHVPRGQKNQRHAGRLIEIERVGNRNHIRRGNRDQLTVSSIHAIAQHGKCAALILQSRNTLLALSAIMHGRQQHALARFESADVLAYLDHFAGDVAAENVWQLHSRKTLAHPDVEMIQRTGAHSNQHLIIADLWIGHIFVSQNFRPAELMNADSLHNVLPGA